MYIDKTNRDNLDAMERCIYVLCLDSSAPTSSFSAGSQGDASVSEDKPQQQQQQQRRRSEVTVAEQMIHGHGSRANGANRWFDNTLQVKYVE